MVPGEAGSAWSGSHRLARCGGHGRQVMGSGARLGWAGVAVFGQLGRAWSARRRKDRWARHGWLGSAWVGWVRRGEVDDAAPGAAGMARLRRSGRARPGRHGAGTVGSGHVWRGRQGYVQLGLGGFDCSARPGGRGPGGPATLRWGRTRCSQAGPGGLGKVGTAIRVGVRFGAAGRARRGTDCWATFGLAGRVGHGAIGRGRRGSARRGRAGGAGHRVDWPGVAAGGLARRASHRRVQPARFACHRKVGPGKAGRATLGASGMAPHRWVRQVRPRIVGKARPGRRGPATSAWSGGACNAE